MVVSSNDGFYELIDNMSKKKKRSRFFGNDRPNDRGAEAKKLFFCDINATR
jgi:hypothetical protein